MNLLHRELDCFFPLNLMKIHSFAISSVARGHFNNMILCSELSPPMDPPGFTLESQQWLPESDEA
jgi:hypothetical protein